MAINLHAICFRGLLVSITAVTYFDFLIPDTATTIMASPNTERIKNEIFKLNRPDINPTTGGPINKPIIPMEETAAIATGGAIVPDLPAALKTSGTAGDTPTPTKNIPNVAVIK